MELLNDFIHFVKNTEQKSNLSPSKSIFAFWGFHHFDEKIRTWLQDNQIDASNHKSNQIIIQEYVKTTIRGIQLVEPQIENYTDFDFEDQEKTASSTGELEN